MSSQNYQNIRSVSQTDNKQSMNLMHMESGKNDSQSFSNNSSFGKKMQENKKQEEIEMNNPDSKMKRRMKTEVWSFDEVKTIFHLYDEYGSQWKIMEAEFTGRVANSIKNRFYTVIRTLLKIMFRQHPSILQKLPHEIPSKTILKFYEGRDEFAIFKGLGKKILKTIDYNLESKQIKSIVEEHEAEIQAVYELIFDMKVNETHPRFPIRKYQSQGQLQQLHSSNNNNQNKSPKSMPLEKVQTKTEISEINDLYSESMVIFLPVMNCYSAPAIYSPFFAQF